MKNNDNDMVRDIKEFMLAVGQKINEYDVDQMDLYNLLIIEEFKELSHAIYAETLEQEVKETIDLIMVCIARLISMGIDANKAWRLVYGNNMEEFEEGIVKDENGNILKSEASRERKAQMMEDISMLFYNW